MWVEEWNEIQWFLCQLHLWYEINEWIAEPGTLKSFDGSQYETVMVHSFYSKGRLVLLHVPFKKGLAAQLWGMESGNSLKLPVALASASSEVMSYQNSSPRQIVWEEGGDKDQIIAGQWDHCIRQYLLQSLLPALWGLHCNFTSAPSCFCSFPSQGLSFTNMSYAKLHLSSCIQRTWPAVADQLMSNLLASPWKGWNDQEDMCICSV